MKQLNCSVLLSLTGQVQTTFKILHFWVNSFKTACHYLAILAKWLPACVAPYCHSKFATLFPAELDVCVILILAFNWMQYKYLKNMERLFLKGIAENITTIFKFVFFWIHIKSILVTCKDLHLISQRAHFRQIARATALWSWGASRSNRTNLAVRSLFSGASLNNFRFRPRLA